MNPLEDTLTKEDLEKAPSELLPFVRCVYLCDRLYELQKEVKELNFEDGSSEQLFIGCLQFARELYFIAAFGGPDLAAPLVEQLFSLSFHSSKLAEEIRKEAYERLTRAKGGSENGPH